MFNSMFFCYVPLPHRPPATLYTIAHPFAFTIWTSSLWNIYILYPGPGPGGILRTSTSENNNIVTVRQPNYNFFRYPIHPRTTHIQSSYVRGFFFQFIIFFRWSVGRHGNVSELILIELWNIVKHIIEKIIEKRLVAITHPGDLDSHFH